MSFCCNSFISFRCFKLAKILSSQKLKPLSSKTLFAAKVITGKRLEEEKIDLSLAFDGDIQYIDVCSLAKHLKIVQTKLSETEITFSINGTSATFQNEQTKATVNGFQIEMPAKAVIKNDYCLIPLSTVREIFHGIHILAQQEHTNVSSTESKIYIITTDEMEIEYITNVSEYLSYIHSNDPYIYTLVNKDKTLGANFPPDLDLLIEIPEKYRKPSEIFLYYVAEYALEAIYACFISIETKSKVSSEIFEIALCKLSFARISAFL